jgi:hypothetical protein
VTEQDLPWPAFDDDVVRAMAKWPDVPQCFGWLSLDPRGAWRIQGEIIRHPRAQAFLSRHYRADDSGRWYVQNGPQQVFVDLDYTPWIYRWQPDQTFLTHTGMAARDLAAVYQDDEGNLLLRTSLGIGLLDDRDLASCESLIECDEDDVPRALLWREHVLPLARLARAEVASRFGFVAHPR